MYTALSKVLAAQVEFNCNDGFPPEYCSGLGCKLEYGGINNQLRRAYERLLRKLLMLPRRPAVVLLQTFDFSERCDPHITDQPLISSDHSRNS